MTGSEIPNTTAGGPSPALALLRAVGSLWYAAVLLMLLLVGMAYATVFESLHGTERALEEFYYSRWFTTLMALLAVNVAAAMLIRFPFKRRQTGFVVTHVCILVTLAGALITSELGTNGRIFVGEDQTVDEFTVRGKSTLSVSRAGGGEAQSIELRGRKFRGYVPVDHPSAPTLSLGELQIEIEQYLPDSDNRTSVTNTGDAFRHAVEVSLSESGTERPTWVFAGRPDRIEGLTIEYRLVDDSDEAKRVLARPVHGVSAGGLLAIEHQGITHRIPLADALRAAVPVSDTGYTAEVLHYYPHATVGADKKLVNASDRPENPAVQVELVSGDQRETHIAFANYPQFKSLHGHSAPGTFNVTFTAPSAATADMPIEVVGTPTGELFVRFCADGARLFTEQLAVGSAVDSPWPGLQFSVLRHYDHATVDSIVVPRELRSEARIPALMLRVSTADEEVRTGVQKYDERKRVTIGGVSYGLSYTDQELPLGYSLKLDRFHLGTYPGSSKPRSFESHVTLTDPSSGGLESRIVSMNHPVTFGGYDLFQSSYQFSGGQAYSLLSVSHDPGRPIVFAGYIGTLIGMVIVLGTRMAEHRRKQRYAGS